MQGEVFGVGTLLGTALLLVMQMLEDFRDP